MAGLFRLSCRLYYFSFSHKDMKSGIPIGTRVIVGNSYENPGIITEVIPAVSQFIPRKYKIIRASGKTTSHYESSLRKWDNFFQDYQLFVDKVEWGRRKILDIEAETGELAERLKALHC